MGHFRFPSFFCFAVLAALRDTLFNQGEISRKAAKTAKKNKEAKVKCRYSDARLKLFSN